MQDFKALGLYLLILTGLELAMRVAVFGSLEYYLAFIPTILLLFKVCHLAVEKNKTYAHL